MDFFFPKIRPIDVDAVLLFASICIFLQMAVSFSTFSYVYLLYIDVYCCYFTSTFICLKGNLDHEGGVTAMFS